MADTGRSVTKTAGSVRSKVERPAGQVAHTAAQGIVLHVEGVGLATPARPFLVEFFPTPEQVAAEEIARSRELAFQERNARRALATVDDKWWKRRNVVGLSVTYRTKFGETVSPLQYVVQVDVQRKYGEDVLRMKRVTIFSKEICGHGKRDLPVCVKVREMRYVRAIASGITLSTAEKRALTSSVIQGGIQIASTSNPDEWGTLGICLPHGDPGSDGIVPLVGISNEHVTGESPAQIRNPSGTSTALGNEVFGKVLLSSIDQSLIERLTTSGNRFFQEGLQDGIHNPGTDLLFMKDRVFEGRGISSVWKFGARTGYTTGTIVQKSGKIRVRGFVNDFVDVITFKGSSDNLVLDGGDSGSVLVAEVDGKNVVIGLVFAQTDTTNYGIALPFGRVIHQLSLKIPSSRLHTFK